MTAARICLTLAIALSAVVALPVAASAGSSGDAVGHQVAGAPQGPPAAGATCRPEPPDYPGCTPAQVRPLLKARFATEYTGHAYGYRYYRMGQHPRGVIFAHLLPRLNARLARLYAAAVRRYAAAHRSVTVDRDGHRRVVVGYPHYRTWGGFRAHTTALCTGDNVTIHFPSQYCWSITKIGQAGAKVNQLFERTKRIALSCDGFAIGGWSTGTYAGWRMGTGALEGGYYGAVGVEIGCQTTNLWNWVTNLW